MLLVDIAFCTQLISIFLANIATSLELGEASSKYKATNDVHQTTTSVRKPNFVVFLVDDLGIGDIGCFGNDTIKTPNIDRLAARGAKLNHNLSPESICTPSRAAMLTGRYAIRSGLASGPGELRVLSNLACSGGLPNNETTFAKALLEIGYRTSMIGKWHLGLHCEERDYCHHPLNMGFDEYYGLPFTNLRDCGPYADGSSFLQVVQRLAHRVTIAFVVLCLGLLATSVISKRVTILFGCFGFLCLLLSPYVLQIIYSRLSCITMRGFAVVEQPTNLENLTVRFTNEARGFIRQNKQEPFLLFMSYAKVHAVLFTSPKFKGHSAHGHYGDNVEEMDWSVGEIVSTLEEENLLEDTLVYFTSDHGPFLEIISSSGEHLGGSNGPYKGGKAQTWEGGIRVPTVAMWKDHIPEGIIINEPTNSMDLFTTMIEMAGGKIPEERTIDGKNILPLLLQEQVVSPHEFMFHYCGSAIHAVRYRPRSGLNVTWKAHFVTPVWASDREVCDSSLVLCPCFGDHVTLHDPPLLYDVTHDPYERYPLEPLLEQHHDIISMMKQAVKNHQREIRLVPKQLGYPRARPQLNPLLQPCCNFPYCFCDEAEQIA